jgi:hypothetical protein
MAEHAAAAATPPAATEAFPATAEVGVVVPAKTAAGGMSFMQVIRVDRLVRVEVEVMVVMMTLAQGVHESMVQAHGQNPIYRRCGERYIFRYI